ncbi:MAG: DUF2628 domain-containing protein [Alphaproteobacteria bacterium]
MPAQRSFTIHTAPPEQAGVDADAKVQVVQDSFMPLAFVAPWLYFLTQRMWLEFIGYCALLVAMVVTFWAIGLPETARTVIPILVSFLIGLEASNLKRWNLARRGFEEAAVIVAGSRDEAERRWFNERASRLAPTVPNYVGAPMPSPSAPIFGLFPEAQPRPRGFS